MIFDELSKRAVPIYFRDDDLKTESEEDMCATYTHRAYVYTYTAHVSLLERLVQNFKLMEINTEVFMFIPCVTC